MAGSAFSETSEAASGYVNGAAVGIPTLQPEGDITYTGTIGPNVTVGRVYASIVGQNDTFSDVTGIIKLQNIGAGGVVTNEIFQEVTFTATKNLKTTRLPVMAKLENTYTPGESFVLNFTVGGEEKARFEQTSVARNDTDQIYRASLAAEPDAYTVTEDDPVWDWSTTLGEAKIARWDGNRIGAYSIIIDDNLFGDHAAWREFSARYDIPVSWAIVSHSSALRTSNGNPVDDYSREAVRADLAMGLVSDKSNVTIYISDVVMIAERAVGGAIPFPVDLPGQP